MDDVDLTLAEASQILDPPIGERALRDIIRALAIPAAGVRRNGHIGRPEQTFNAGEIMRLHAALAPWLVTPGN